MACSLVRTNWIVPATGQKLAYTQNVINAARYWREMIGEPGGSRGLDDAFARFWA